MVYSEKFKLTLRFTSPHVQLFWYLCVVVFTEVNSLQRKLEAQSRQLLMSEQMCRDVRSSESDLQETLAVKETQLDVLRMRLNEADRLLELEKQRIADLQADKDRSVASLMCD